MRRRIVLPEVSLGLDNAPSQPIAFKAPRQNLAEEPSSYKIRRLAIERTSNNRTWNTDPLTAF
jgi:hypothetical protein